jgi:hypothetical protein
LPDESGLRTVYRADVGWPARLLVSAVTIAHVGCGRIEYALGDGSLRDGSLGDGSLRDGDATLDDGGTAGFCASHPPVTFCSDFDDGTGLDPWDGPSSMVLGTIGVEAIGRSPPSGAVSTSESVPSGMRAATYVTRELGVAGTHASLAFDVQVTAAGGGSAVVLHLLFDDGTALHEIEYVYLEPPGTGYIEEVITLAGDSTYESYPLPSSFPLGEWHRIGIDVDLDPSGRVQVTRDGALQLDAALVGTTAGQVRLGIGVVYLAGPAAEWRVEHDNVVIDVE